MAKQATVFVCSNCGNESSKWFGKCVACNECNTCYEEKVNNKTSGKSTAKKQGGQLTSFRQFAPG